MQELSYSFPADPKLGDQQRVHVGVVGSGDLEVLYRPDHGTSAEVQVRTSVDGFDSVWSWVLERFFAAHPLPGSFQCNDFGATPAVVTLRLRQLAQAAGAIDAGARGDDR